jgi:hypothetical protein
MKAPTANPAGGAFVFLGSIARAQPNSGKNAAGCAFYPIKQLWITA